MSKKKPSQNPDAASKLTSIEDIERFAKLLDYFLNRCNSMIQQMQKHHLPSLHRTSKRHEKIKIALDEYVGGLERVLAKVTLDIDASESRQLKVADTRLPYESDSEKNDKK